MDGRGGVESGGSRQMPLLRPIDPIRLPMIITPSPSTAGARIRRGWRLNRREVQLNMTGGRLNQVIDTRKASTGIARRWASP